MEHRRVGRAGGGGRVPTGAKAEGEYGGHQEQVQPSQYWRTCSNHACFLTLGD